MAQWHCQLAPHKMAAGTQPTDADNHSNLHATAAMFNVSTRNTLDCNQSKVDSGSLHTLGLFADNKNCDQITRAIWFGCGPSIHHHQLTHPRTKLWIEWSVAKIWLFEVFPEKLFQKDRMVICRWSLSPQYSLHQWLSTGVPRFRICQGFCSWPVKITQHAKSRQWCRNTQHQFFCLKLRFYALFCINLLCWIVFVVNKISAYLHFRPT